MHAFLRYVMVWGEGYVTKCVKGHNLWERREVQNYEKLSYAINV